MSRALKARNQLAAACRHHPDQVEDRRRALAEAKITDYVERVLAEAPPLTQEQRTKLAELLAPVRRATAERGDLDA
jgi:hypothetical protein